MPCNDQSENIEIILDANDCIESFELHKLSCVRQIGEGRFKSYIQGYSSQSVLEKELDHFIPEDESLDEQEEFLITKEFTAIKAALSVFLGSEPGRLSDLFTLRDIEVDQDTTKITGIVNLTMIRENIKACGSCCGSKPSSNSLTE